MQSLHTLMNRNLLLIQNNPKELGFISEKLRNSALIIGLIKLNYESQKDVFNKKMKSVQEVVQHVIFSNN